MPRKRKHVLQQRALPSTIKPCFSCPTPQTSTPKCRTPGRGLRALRAAASHGETHGQDDNGDVGTTDWHVPHLTPTQGNPPCVQRHANGVDHTAQPFSHARISTTCRHPMCICCDAPPLHALNSCTNHLRTQWHRDTHRPSTNYPFWTRARHQ